MRYKPKIAALLALFASGTGLMMLSSAVAQTPYQDIPGIEIQARGVVHEAFAQPVNPNVPQPGPIVPKPPPPPIPEVPAELQPQGANVQWFSGYWAWEAETNEFVWITGGYRNVPPGQRYMAGYWEQTPEGWRWINGFWAPLAQQELPYLPEPPAPLEVGPVLPPPGDNYYYAPGAWAYRQSRYVWQPGYYAQCQPGLVWIPPRYAWTPNGFLCLPGYFDYPFDQCGLMFAPVAFRQPLWGNPGWRFRPHFALGFSALFDSLFVDVRFGNYRYGDYYGRSHIDRGIHPWHVHGPRHFDPHFGYYRWQNGNNPNWQTGLARRYDDRVGGRLALPPRTLAQQNQVFQQNNANGFRMIQPVTQFNDKGIKLARVTEQGLTQQQLAVQRQLDASTARLKSETTFAKGKGAGKVGPAALRIGDFANVNSDAVTKGPTKSVDPKFTIPDKKGSVDAIPPKNLQTIPPGKKGSADFIPPGKKGGADVIPPKNVQTIPPAKKATVDVPPPGKKGGADATTAKSFLNTKPPDPPKSVQTIPPTKKANTDVPPGSAKTIPNVQPPEVSKLPPPTTTQKQVVQQAKQQPPVTTQKSTAQSGPPPTIAKQLPPPTVQKQQVVQQAKSLPPTVQKQVTPPPTVRSSPSGSAKASASTSFKAPPAAKSQSSSAARGSPPPASRQVQAGSSSRPPASSGGGNRGGGGGGKSGKKK